MAEADLNMRADSAKPVPDHWTETSKRKAAGMTPGDMWASTFPGVVNPTLRVLSHGGGIQTSTLLFMAARGEIAPFDAVIISDTGDEPQEVWDYLDYAIAQTGIPVIRTMSKTGSILDHIKRSKGPPDGKLLVTLPYFLGDGGQMMRTCTKTLKIDPVTQEIRKLLGIAKGCRVKPGTQVEVAIGISTDEYTRAGGFPATHWQTVVYPLLSADMSFNTCVRWLEERQYRKPPRSRCRVCPFRSNESWRALSAPDFEHACCVDDSLRVDGPPRGFKSLPYLHRDRIPLREVDLSAPDLFPQQDCTGACAT